MMRAKKSLGQHFLTSQSALATIVETADLKENDTIVEIGPGKGALTTALLARARHVIAIEKDERLTQELEALFVKEIAQKQLLLVSDDALSFDPGVYKLGDTSYKVVANIPYYITGALLEHFLTAAAQPTSMTLLLQKEVAERIAKSKKESILSLSVKAYGTPHYVKTVPAHCFNPPPKVDSALLHISNISRAFFDGISESFFFDVARSGFSQKRKQLLGNLRSFGNREALENVFTSIQLPLSVRAEDVPLSTWKKIAKAFLENQQKT